ncbi:hypothetical protein E9993_06300 [Labilibacter sediminis]|nr:hypothetical protein E9993_06300 [Labilibacter sediminis]
MKKLSYKIGFLALAIAILIPTSIFAQQKEVHVFMHKDSSKCDSLISKFWSTTFKVESVKKMHEKLDSIFEVLDEDLQKQIKILAYDAESMLNDFEFKVGFDSVFSLHKLSTNDMRIDALLKAHQPKGGLNKIVIKDGRIINEHGVHPDELNIEVITDTVIKNGKTLITKEVIVMSDDSLLGADAPMVIKKYGEEGEPNKEIVIAYKHKEGFKQPGEHIKLERAQRTIKEGKVVGRKEYVVKIDIADAELLVKGGVSPKVISAPALKPAKIGVNIKVENKFGNQLKSVGMSVDFEDSAPLHVLVLDNRGRKVFEDKRKSFTGTYSYNVEINESLTPYYFLMIRNKQLFGRKIQD